MRKFVLLAAAFVALFATAAVAVAQSGAYTVTAATSPAKAGSKKKPVAVQMKFGIDAASTATRPQTATRFKVSFEGMRSNGRYFKTCSVKKMNDTKSDRSCSKASKVGTGHVHNLAGSSLDQADTSITCDLNLTIYNTGNKSAALWLRGGPGVSGASCPITISQAIPARFVRISGGEALQFDIPTNLQHPITGLDNAIVAIDATVLKRTVKLRKGKKSYRVGYFEAVGCKGGDRSVTLDLSLLDGSTTTATGAAKC